MSVEAGSPAEPNELLTNNLTTALATYMHV